MDEPLHTFVKPDNTVTLHHFAKVNGDVPEITVDPSRFGESPWSKNEKKADPTPKSFYYLDPKDQESFFQGRTHFSTEYPADKIYDLSKDEKNVLGRIARRGGPVIANTLKVLNRLGYHGVYYSGSFPTVAMLKPVKVQRAEEAPMQLQRIKLSEEELDARTIFQGIKPKDIQFVINGVHFARKKEHFLDDPVWHVNHLESGRTMQLPHDKFLAVVKGLPAEHKAKIREAIGRFNSPKKFARNGYGYCSCGAPFLKHDKEKQVVYCPNGHSQRRRVRPAQLSLTRDSEAVKETVAREQPDHGHPLHSILADALEDQGHPLADLVRGHTPDIRGQGWRLANNFRHGTVRIGDRGSRIYVQHNPGDPRFHVSWVFDREGQVPFGRMFSQNYSRLMSHDEFATLIDRWPEGHQKEQLKDLHQRLVNPLAPYQLSATRAPQGGAIVNNQFHTGGQFLPKALMRIRDVVAKRRKKLGHSVSKVSATEGWIAPEGTFHPITKKDEGKHINVAARLFPKARRLAEDPRRHAEAAGYMHVAHTIHAGDMEVHGYHPEGRFTPEQLEKLREIARNAGAMYAEVSGGRVMGREVRLARAEAEKVLTPEDNAVGNTKSTKATYDKLVSQSFDNHPKSVLPTMDEIKALAKAGESTKGQYEHAGKVLTSFIGPENAKLWVAANAILSPLAKWEHHSRAALRLVRLWREAGSPSDPDTVHKIVERIGPGNAESEVDAQGKKIYPSVGFYSSKAPKLREMLMNHQEFLKRIENVAATNRGKIVEFGRAFADPNGVPIDTHMGKAVVPSGTEVTGKLPKDAGNDTKADLKDLIRSTKTPHLLARAIAEQGNPQLHSALLEAQKKLVASPALQKAYKVAIAEAAIQLGWEPRQVQETLWSAVVAIIAAKNRGIATKDILSRLRHENAFQAWNVGGLLSTPEVLHDVGLLSRRPSSAFAAEADRAPSATGQIATGNDPAFEAVAARIPANTRNQGAWNAIQASLRG